MEPIEHSNDAPRRSPRKKTPVSAPSKTNHHTLMSREDDLRLWEGHNMYGNAWKKINIAYFDGTRDGEYLRNRWKSKSFKALIADEFGPDAYIDKECRIDSKNKHVAKKRSTNQNRTNKAAAAAAAATPAASVVSKKSKAAKKTRKSKHKEKALTSHITSPQFRHHTWTKTEDKLILKIVTKSMREKGDKLSCWSELAKRLDLNPKQVRDRWCNHLDPKIDHTPMSREDDLLLWDGQQRFGNEWQKINDHYFKGTRPAEVLRGRWKRNGFKAVIKENIGLAGCYAQKFSTSSSSGISMDIFGSDILYRIASFLPSMKSLVLFCSTSKQANLLLKDSCLSESLYGPLFLSRFSVDGGSAEQFGATWKERWIGIVNFKRRFKEHEDSSCTILPNTIGVLQPHAHELSAILYDNTMYHQENSSNGYFGLSLLSNLPRPPNAADGWQAPILLRGDFNGVKIFNSLEDITTYDNSSLGRFFSLGDDEAVGQVLTFLVAPPNVSLGNNNDELLVPCAFVGCASGRVYAIHATLTDDRTSYEYSWSHWHAHNSEVTSLAIADGRLFSACCGGNVYSYANYGQAELAFTNENNCPIFSMTTIEMLYEGASYELLITGDQSGMISLWSVDEPGIGSSCLAAVKGAGDNHPVTVATMIKGNVLVTGNTDGDISFWRLKLTPSGKLLNSDFDLIKIHKRAHLGSVEMCVVVGDVVMTSGGNDGSLVGWDASCCARIGQILCHQWRLVPLPGRRKRIFMRSCVVGAILPSSAKGKLISLCRDGVLAQWSFKEE